MHVAGDKVKGPGQTHANEEPNDDEKALHPRLSNILTGRGCPDSKAYGVRGEKEEDDIEGEQDADRSLQRELKNQAAFFKKVFFQKLFITILGPKKHALHLVCICHFYREV